MRSDNGGKAASRLEAIITSATGAIVTADSDGVIVTWHRTAERMFGYAGKTTLI